MEQQQRKLEKELQELRQIVATLQVHNPRQSQEAVISSSTTMINSLPQMQKFSFDKTDWPQWISHYERYRVISGLNKAEEKLQITNLLLQMGPEVDKLLEKLKKPENSLTTYKETRELFDNHFISKKNIIYERAKFNLRTQQEGETAKEFIDSLTVLAKSCEFGHLMDQLIRDRLVVGIRDHKLSEMLQLDDALTLEKAIEKITQSETVKEQNKELREKLSRKVDRINKGKYKTKFKERHDMLEGQASKHENKRKCSRCGITPRHRTRECPAIKEKCNRCKIKGHYASMCKTKSVKNLSRDTGSSSEISGSDSTTSDTELGEIKNISVVSKPWTIKLNVAGKSIRFKIDSGADETVITTNTYKQIRENCKLKSTHIKLVGPGEGKQTELKMKGVVKVPVAWQGTEEIIKLYVVKTSENLLGRPALETLKILQWPETSQEISQIREDNSKYLFTKEEIRNKFSSLFEGLGKLQNLKQAKEQQKKNYNKRHRARELEEFEEGTSVWIITENKDGIITKKRGEPRSYDVETDNGKLRRNRRHLQKLPTEVPPQKVQKDNNKKDGTESYLEGRPKRNIKTPAYLNEYKCSRN